jgi:predicted outer membrane repeat protein
MTGGTISNNTAETGNAGGIRVNHITITGGEFSGNKANGKTVTGEGGAQTVENGKGGAIYTRTGANVSINGATFTDNEAYQGGAVYDQAASFTVENVTMTGNSAIKNGGAVYVSSIATNDDGSAKTGPFNMSGGIISGNSSPEGAISTGERAVLNFSGNASVTGNTNGNDSEPVIMNVFLGYHSNTIIKASGLTGTDPIGVYVKDGEDSVIYNNHGIANRPFGTGATESEDNLSKFVNDQNPSLKGVRGLGNLIMWPGKDLKIQVFDHVLLQARI